MKKILMLLLALTMIASFVYGGGQAEEEMSSEPMITGAYVPGQTEIAYGYTHGGYVTMAKVMTDDNGDLSVSIDEAFLPHTLAIVKTDSAEWNDDNTTQYLSRGNVATVAKYIGYNDKMYIAVPTGSTFSYVEAGDDGVAKGGKDIEKEILRNQDTMAAYYALVPAGKFVLYPELGGKGIAVTTTGYGGVTKKNSPGYWGPTETRTRTWMSNIAAIEDFIAENGVQFNESDMVRATEENDEGAKLWSVADAVTGATNSDFKDYFGIAHRAAGKLKTN